MENNRIFQSQIEQMSEKIKQMQNEVLMASTVKKQKTDLEEQVERMAEQIKQLTRQNTLLQFQVTQLTMENILTQQEEQK